MKKKSFFDEKKIYDSNGTLLAAGISFGENLPSAFITTKAAHSMKFRWNEENNNRKKIFEKCRLNLKNLVSIELNHTKTVYAVESSEETNNKIGDGLISINKKLILSVTVADCMPIYFFDPVTKCFGIVHSGWKGTGIIEEAVLKAKKLYGAKSENIKVILGPHIKDCCYETDNIRADYFRKNFCNNCITEKTDNKFMLSLEKANLSILEKCGIKPDNIICSSDCTCCDSRLGSFRRECVMNETKILNFSDPNEPPQNFTRMAAFICY
jgi:YfiH family protein